MRRKYIGHTTSSVVFPIVSGAIYNIAEIAYNRSISVWPGPDPYYRYTVVNYHMNDGTGSSSVTNHSPSKFTAYLRGTATLSTASLSPVTEGAIYPPTGDRTVLLSDGATNNYLWVSGASDFNLGSGSYTVEGWLKVASTAGDIMIWNRCNQNSGLTIEHAFYQDNSTQLSIYYGVRGSSQTVRAFTSPVTFASGTWYHLAWTRDSTSTMRAFVNGVVSATTFVDNTNFIAPGAISGSIGNFNDFAGPGFAYMIDDVRLTRNICRYSASFTTSSIHNPNY